jgi:glycosyltransferase involved in cell wall biosynthesis
MGAIVVSDDSKQYLEYVFPHLDVWRIHNAINTDVFSFSADKKKQICYMPRKHAEDAIQVLGILKLRNALKDFAVVAIENLNEAGVANVLKESMLFLSFGYPEGCPLPPAEAMACGCIVVGYDGFGGREYFNPEFSYPIGVGDITGYVDTVETVLSLSMQNPAALVDKAKKASEYVRSVYSPKREAQDILQIWKPLAAQ